MTNNNIYFVANWKMFGNLSSVNTIKKLFSLIKLKKFKRANIIYCPPFTILDRFIRNTKKTKISIGAQDCFHVDGDGAFTGNVSAKQLKILGVKYVILGHSEKRNENDNDKIINKKIRNDLKNKLKVILCIGENFAEKKKNKTYSVIKKQLNNCLKGIKNTQKIIIAYEPVWSIGTGHIPKTQDLESTIKLINYHLLKKYRKNNIPILYGGSVNPKNVGVLKKTKMIKGFLVGGASQNQNKFIDIIKKTIN